jgi:NAD(P)-dependent dehydrogenase (short-subunit alcohol dehydrogenase family)
VPAPEWAEPQYNYSPDTVPEWWLATCVNSVCPAGRLTHFGGLDPEGPNAEAIRTGMGSIYPLGRAVDPADCAAAAMFLASDLAKSITGVNLPVDSGLAAGVRIQRRK